VSEDYDPLAEARALLARYGALSNREPNYRSAMYADLFSYVLADLVASCTPLRAEHAAQLEDILHRAWHGPATRAMTARTRLRVVR
jgi:hypothetical protein